MKKKESKSSCYLPSHQWENQSPKGSAPPTCVLGVRPDGGVCSALIVESEVQDGRWPTVWLCPFDRTEQPDLEGICPLDYEWQDPLPSVEPTNGMSQRFVKKGLFATF